MTHRLERMSADEEPTQLSELEKILNPGGAGREGGEVEGVADAEGATEVAVVSIDSKETCASYHYYK